MKAADIIRLLDAGYTKEQIEGFENEETETQNDSGSTADNETSAGQEAETVSGQTENDQSSEIKELMKQNAQMLKTIQQMQKQNIANATQPGTAEKKTADTVIKEFITKM